MTAAALATRGLYKNFGALQPRTSSFDLPAGARHALIGPNGAGKTTFVNLLTGALPPDAGRIELDGATSRAAARAAGERAASRAPIQINTLFPT